MKCIQHIIHQTQEARPCSVGSALATYLNPSSAWQERSCRSRQPLCPVPSKWHLTGGVSNEGGELYCLAMLAGDRKSSKGRVVRKRCGVRVEERRAEGAEECYRRKHNPTQSQLLQQVQQSAHKTKTSRWRSRAGWCWLSWWRASDKVRGREALKGEGNSALDCFHPSTARINRLFHRPRILSVSKGR